MTVDRMGERALDLAEEGSAAKAWLRALEMTAPIAREPTRVLPVLIEEIAQSSGNRPALISEDSCWSFRKLTEQSNRYARWALAQGLGKGETVCLLMPSRPEYVAIWLGLTRVGIVVGLLNTNITGPSLAHCVDAVQPRYLLLASELMAVFATAKPYLQRIPELWVDGAATPEFRNLKNEIAKFSAQGLEPCELRSVTIEDQALLIYTSGTTGRPKAARISHYRLMYWSCWFAGIMGIRADDRMYNCLPMYHSVGGVVAIGAMLVRAGSVVLKEKFSARQFWSDIVARECTVFQYIGELCRYLLHAPPDPAESKHLIRLCCGNGLRADVWQAFQDRFRIPKILEFYASTEGNVSMFNCEGKPGAIGRIPGFLVHRFPASLVKFDYEKQAPIRNEAGFCVRCGHNEVGEAIGKIGDISGVGVRFEGYTSRDETEQKIIRDVFEPGDAWFRTGDLMRRDEKGFFYFVDRIGDTFRWKGENVSTLEVSEAIASRAGILEACVYGVRIPGTDGRAGMAALVVGEQFDLEALRRDLRELLPEYACPLFLRICKEIETTGTFKQQKQELMREGYDPHTTSDAIYFDDRQRECFVRLDRALYKRIQSGQVRL